MLLLELLIEKSYIWLVCLIGPLLYYSYSRRKLYRLSWQLPGPNPALPLLGNTLLFFGRINDILSLVEKVISQYSKKCGMVRIWFGPKLMLFINDPEVAYQVNQKTQLKSEEYQYLGKTLTHIDRGLFNSNDIPQWRRSKKIYLLGVSSENLKSFVPKFHEECLRVVDKFRKISDLEQSVNPTEIFFNMTYCCIVRCAMNFDIHTKDEAENEHFIESCESVLQLFQLRLMIPPLRNDFIYFLVGLRAKELKAINIFSSYCKSILDHHKKIKHRNKIKKNQNNNKEKSFVEHLMDDDSQMPESEIVAHMMTMVISGIDTLSPDCTVLLILLAQNPLIQQKVYEESIQILGDDFTICPSAEDLNKLEYLPRVLKECLRMFPAAPIIGRSFSEDITLKGSDNKHYVIPEGATMVLSIKTIQNNPEYYESPNTFDPDRWLPENVAKRSPMSFLPFNNGPRKCIAGKYAMLQMKVMAVTIIRAFEIVPSKDCEKFEDIQVEMSMTLKIGENSKIMFKERKRHSWS